MAQKKTPEPQTPKRDPRAIIVPHAGPGDQAAQDASVARAILRPTVTAAQSIKDCHPNEDKITVAALADALAAQSATIREGNTARVEAMLTAQAHTLDALFLCLTRSSHANMGKNLHAMEAYMRLALKAQAQCRTTLQTLADIKNPAPRVQNNTATYQQVNTGTPAPVREKTPPAPKSKALD